jgi:hypothetical protein
MDKTILILGSDEDEHARHVLAHLRGRGCDTELLDSRWFPGQMKISLEPDAGTGSLLLPGGRRIALSEVRSVYWRSYYGVVGPSLPDPEQAWIAQNDARGLFESLLIGLPTRWVNGWDGYWLHQTKPVQLARVAALGVHIPATLLSNDPQRVRAFAAGRKNAIVKPVQGGDHARRLSAEHLADDHLRHLQLAPITLQAEVPGTNIRAFVAGDEVHACEIRTSQLDYRDDPTPQLLVHALPAEMVQLARRIARELHLLWTGIDFRLTPEGEYVFLEANPSPMFLGFEAQTGLPLTESLAALLV